MHFAAVILGALLFAGAFPNILFENGISILAWIAFIPIFWLLRRVNILTSFFWGSLYGYSAYSIFNFWLTAFHPIAGLVVNIVYLVYFTFFFPLLKLATILFPRKGYILQWLMWICFEYLRTQGFLGYAYGIIGYSQWQVIPLIQIADIFGIWAVSAIVIFPSVWLAEFFYRRIHIKEFFLQEKISACLWFLALAMTIVYGFNSQIDYSVMPSRRFALIQHNTDPWAGGFTEYKMNYEILKRLSNESLSHSPKPDFVVWSETAFIPRIYWHITYRGDPDSYLLVRDLMEYLGTQDVPFIIGNDDARKEPAKNPNPAEEYRVDYNAAMLFEKGEIIEQYRKIHLVPFTEHFPYKRQFPRLHEALRSRDDIHLWEKGDDIVVFESQGIKFSTPICFEDTFGYISRDFTHAGAQLIVNLTNDAWSNSLPAQMQHLAMAVFRSVENRRSMVRSTASGQTCGIDPNGRIIAMAKPFQENYLNVEVPIVTISSIYTRYGDFFPIICIVLTVILMILGIVLKFFKKLKKI